MKKSNPNDFKNKVVVITGGARGIGKAIADYFRKAKSRVCIIDVLNNDYFVGDVGNETTLIKFANKVIKDYGKIDYLIHNACISRGGLKTASIDEFDEVYRVCLRASFILAQLFMNHFSQQGSIINIASTRALMSQPNTESYSAAKGGLVALTHAMAMTLGPAIRVNAVSPGWIHTSDHPLKPLDHDQHPVGRVGKPDDIVNMVAYLCSEQSGFITGQNFIIDGGMSKQMIYHDDLEWHYQPEAKKSSK